MTQTLGDTNFSVKSTVSRFGKISTGTAGEKIMFPSLKTRFQKANLCWKTQERVPPTLPDGAAGENFDLLGQFFY